MLTRNLFHSSWISFKSLLSSCDNFLLDFIEDVFNGVTRSLSLRVDIGNAKLFEENTVSHFRIS